MAARLKLVINQIHWSLAAKSLILSFSLIFSWNLFFILALFFYFYPPFQSLLFFLPFLIYLILTKILSLNIFTFFLFAALIYLILGIKDLIIINRFLAYQILGYLFIFSLAFAFFSKIFIFTDWKNSFYGLLLALYCFLFFKGINKFSLEKEIDFKKYKIILAVFSLFLFELIFILNFLPFSFYLKTLILMLIVIFGMETIFNYFLNKINKTFIIVAALIFTFLFVLTLIFNHWSLY